MKRHIKYRPNKAEGAFGVVWGAIFILIGLFVVIPSFGPFGILWTIAAIAITAFNAYRAFGQHYVGPDITIEDDEPSPSQSGDSFYSHPADSQPAAGPSSDRTPQKRMEQLEELKRAGLITEEEYREKRDSILRDL